MRRGKKGKQKSRSKEKVMGFISSSLFPTRKGEAVSEGRTRGIDHPMWRKVQGSSIIKGWEDKRDDGRILDTFT